MSATICAFVLTLSTLCGSRVVSGFLSPPKNVRLTSHNMNMVLKWEPPEGAASDVVYTVESINKFSSNIEVCSNISTTECDIGSHIDINVYGKYESRVRAQSGAESSLWVKSNTIVPDKDTVIGSPSVSLFPNEGAIEVSITDPVFATSSLRDVYQSAVYTITYWKADEKKEVWNISDIQQNRVVLNDLDPQTKYCVQVQIQIKIAQNSNPSKPSAPICENTTHEEGPQWVAAVVTFVFMVMAVTLVVVTVVYRKKISHFLCPKDTLPQHFKEYLLEPPKSSIYLAMRNSHPPEEIYHQVSIVTYGKTMEEGRPLEVAGNFYSREPVVTVRER
ncbi:interleukin-10 receptor subunit beta-like [Thunnus thynnus]|uniref:interleukin-10 receptor subunit beta-like n=1 Tax=Thunnus thynnus TaxID=8237 RepID=UPI003526D956